MPADPMEGRILDALRESPLLAPVSEALRDFPGVFVVGGALRDAGLGRGPIVDLDLAVAGPAREAAAAVARALRGTAFVLHAETEVYRVAPKPGLFPPGAQVDVARIQGRDIAQDLARRDFTVNALALPLPLGSGALLDPFGGRADLRKRALRLTAPRVLDEDPLRLIRAYRIAARCGLRLDKAAEREIASRPKLIARCAGERVRAELLALLEAPDSADWVRRLDASGLLTAVFPELEPSRRCAVVYYGKGGVLRHSLDAVARMDFALAGLDRVYPAQAAPIRELLWARPGGLPAQQALLRLAVLLHDVAKPETARRIGGRLRFFKHEQRGAEASERILRRLRFSADEIRMVSTLIAHHLRPGNLAANRSVSDRAAYRFFRDLRPHGVPLLLLAWADHASYLSSRALAGVLGRLQDDPFAPDRRRARAADSDKTLYHLQVVGDLLRRYFALPSAAAPERLLSGEQVMRALALPPGPRIGEALRALEEAQAVGKVRSEDEALRFVRGLKLKTQPPER